MDEMELRMKKRMQKIYFSESKGNHEEIYFSVDCYDKILYHALHEYVGDCKVIFCNDINLGLIKNPFLCYPNDLRLNEEIFSVKKYMPEFKDSFSLLENLIDTGVTVGVCTMFDRLPSYEWYGLEDKRGKSNTHFSLVIGYDKENYYFVDDPCMLKPDAERLPSNSTVAILKKQHLQKAFEEYCQILTVGINTDKLENADKFFKIKDAIVENYYKEKVWETDNVSIGRKALLNLLELLQDDQFFDMIVSNFYWTYLMARKRELFGRCLVEKSWKENVNNVQRIINQSCKEWEMLHSRIRAFVCGSGTAIQTKEKMIKRIEEIIEVEDRMIEAIASLHQE